MPPSPDVYNVDWVFSQMSNVHLANHKDWFKTFVPFESVTEIFQELKVEGAGTVELPVETNSGYAVLKLTNVLYAPTSRCNLLCPDRLDVLGVDLTRHDVSRMYMDQDKTLWLPLDCPKFFRLRLPGQSPEHSSIDPYSNFQAVARLSEEELERLEKTTSEILPEKISVSINLVAPF